MSTLILPDPSLVVLVGAAGSGKSTLAGRWFSPDEILSSDALRLAVSGNEADQAASGVVFRILHRAVESRLGRAEMTVVDATNATAEQRRPLLLRARRARTPAVAIVLDLAPALVLAQNAARTARVVDPEIVERHLAAVRWTAHGDRLVVEGFDHVVLLRSAAEVSGLRIERRGPARPREPAPTPDRRR